MTEEESEIKSLKRQLIAASEREKIERHGLCPHWWGHFDLQSFLMGVGAALWMVFLVWL